MNSLAAIVHTMTSREVAGLTLKRHSDVLRDIDNLIKSLNEELRLGFKSSTYVDSTGKSNRMYEMDRDSVYCLVAGYDPNARMRIIKRWQELEAKQAAPILPDFTNPVIAARAWADEVEQKLLAQAEAERLLRITVEQQPAVDFTDEFNGNIKDSVSIRDASSLLNIKEGILRQVLIDLKMVYRNNNKKLVPYARSKNSGFLRLKIEHINGAMIESTQITMKGIGMLRNVFRSGKIAGVTGVMPETTKEMLAVRH